MFGKIMQKLRGWINLLFEIDQPDSEAEPKKQNEDTQNFLTDLLRLDNTGILLYYVLYKLDRESLILVYTLFDRQIQEVIEKYKLLSQFYGNVEVFQSIDNRCEYNRFETIPYVQDCCFEGCKLYYIDIKKNLYFCNMMKKEDSSQTTKLFGERKREHFKIVDQIVAMCCLDDTRIACVDKQGFVFSFSFNCGCSVNNENYKYRKLCNTGLKNIISIRGNFRYLVVLTSDGKIRIFNHFGENGHFSKKRYNDFCIGEKIETIVLSSDVVPYAYFISVSGNIFLLDLRRIDDNSQKIEATRFPNFPRFKQFAPRSSDLMGFLDNNNVLHLVSLDLQNFLADPPLVCFDNGISIEPGEIQHVDEHMIISKHVLVSFERKTFWIGNPVWEKRIMKSFYSMDMFCFLTSDFKPLDTTSFC
jgi:hypothetical protein